MILHDDVSKRITGESRRQNNRFLYRLRTANAWLLAFGLNIRDFVTGLRGFPRFVLQYFLLRRQVARQGPPVRVRFTMPQLSDRFAEGGTARGHYFHQDLYVARKIHERNPRKHVDIGSRIDGFVAHVAAFRPVEVFDVRPVASNVKNIQFRQMDFAGDISGLNGYSDSVSCLHALEHFGLGRYGEPLDVRGHLKGFENLTRILKKGGILYLSVPIGPERIDFNAHRVFDMSTILGLAGNSFNLVAFSFVDDAGDFHEDVKMTENDRGSNFGCHYGCGIFEFKKRGKGGDRGRSPSA